MATTVVITGASSGIGRALAREGATRGWRLVLVARRETVLDALADELRARGTEVLVAPADVTDAVALDAVAERALDAFGAIDAWVNNAGLYLVGEFEATPVEAFRRVVEVDLLGTVNGSRTALRAFRRHGRGVLVNVSSMVGGLASPYVTAYAAAKWGVRGFSLSLREELRDDPGIEVCVVRPAAIDTPIFRRAANFSGRELQALSPTYAVEDAARTIAGLVTHPRREVIVGGSGAVLSGLHAIAPRLVDRAFARRVPGNHFGDRPAPPTEGNLFESDGGWASESGDWPVTSSPRKRLLASGVAVTLAALAAAAFRVRG